MGEVVIEEEGEEEGEAEAEAEEQRAALCR